jgi:hypothetical protein
MKWIKYFKNYKESLLINIEISGSDVMESLNMLEDVLLNSIDAKEVDLFDTLKVDKNLLDNKLDLDDLFNNVDFINSLTSLSLKKSNLEDTNSYQTFLTRPSKFMFIYGNNQNELENPIYILFQIKDGDQWQQTKLYKIGNDIKRFYDKLSSRTIEIVDGDENYIYTTSNGNDWELQNSLSINDIYKSNFRKEEIMKLIDDRNLKLNFI